MANICNLEQLSVMTGGDKSIMKEFIRMYLTDTPQLLVKIGEANTRQSYVGEESVAWCCHKIAPQLSYMGVSAGYDIAKGIEGRLKELTSGYPELNNELSTLNDICSKSYSELNDFINSNPD